MNWGYLPETGPQAQGTELVSVWTLDMMPVQFHLIFLPFGFNIVIFKAIFYKYYQCRLYCLFRKTDLQVYTDKNML